MTGFLFYFVLILAFICLLGFFNEKVTKLTYEISLLLFSAVIGVVILVSASIFSGTGVGDILSKIQIFDVEKFLMDGVLCFMLFAGSCHMKLSNLKRHARGVTVLAIVGTLLGALFYGGMIFGVASLAGLPLSLPVCLMFGSIVAPTDPIAATGILSKLGLSKDISFLIEGESLFNDGVGVALFVCFSGMVTNTSSSGFFTTMAVQLLGAVLTGAAVTLLLFPIYKFTKSHTLGIFVSLLSVSLSYYVCELIGASGAIASVVCGITFSALRSRFCKGEEREKALQFDSFYETVDSLLNSVLYILLGLTFVRILQMEHVLLLSLLAIVANTVARAGSLSVSSLFMGRLPDNYNRSSFVKLLTWSGLRGGLSVALAMSTREFLPAETYYIILGGTYAIVMFTTVVQGLTLKPLYRRMSSRLGKK